MLLLGGLLAGCQTAVPSRLRVATGDSGDGLEPHRRILARAAQCGLVARLEPIAGGDYYTRLLTALASQDPPDLIQLGDDAVPSFVQRGCLLALDGQLEPGLMDRYLPQVVAPGRWHGSLYLLPKDFTPWAVYVNLRVLRELGVPPPSPDWTIAEFRELARRTTVDRDGDGRPEVWGLVMPGVTPASLEFWAGIFGGRVVTPEGRYQGALDSPATVAALTFWRDLYVTDRVVPLPLELGSDAAGNYEFEQGRAAMRLSGRWFLPALRHNPNVELAVLPPPRGVRRFNLLYWAGFGVASQSRQRKAALQLLEDYCGPAGSQVWTGWGLPAVASVAQEAGFTSDPLERVWLEELAHVQPRAYQFAPNWRERGEPTIRYLMEQVLLQAGVDPAGAATEAARQADRP